MTLPMGTRDGHGLAAEQIRRHGKDRYRTAEKQLRKVGDELLELAMAFGEAYGRGPVPLAHTLGQSAQVRREYADVGLALFELGNKLGLDLIAEMRALVEADTRRF